jgi:hypothetical protein
MWHKTAMAVALVLCSTLPSFAQVTGVYSRAMVPDKALIGRLNLKTEWTVNLPVEGRRDTITQVQTLDDQLFVQTRTGFLIAIDAVNGRIQWFVQLGTGGYVNTYPVAVNSEYVFAANITKLHAFHRYSGVAEFVAELGSSPTTGLAADESGVYCVLGIRPGGSGGHRIVAYDLPRPIAITNLSKPQYDASGRPIKDPKAVNPVDALMNRYPPPDVAYRSTTSDVFEPSARSVTAEVPGGGGLSGTRTPSLNILPKVTPPYTLNRDSSSPSINILSSLRQPYHLKSDSQRDIQQTPSLGVIPPSIAASLALSDLRPRSVEPPLRWEYGLSTRILYPPVITPQRVWVITEGKIVTALNKIDKKIEVVEAMADPISATPGRAGAQFYIPLGSGYVVAVEGTSGNVSGGANVLWRATVGGINNRIPFVTESLVYAAGDNSGVVCLDRKHGEIIWRSASGADRVLAVNQEFVYIMDRQGKFLVYDAKRPTDPAEKRSSPLAGIDMAEFNVPVVNTVSDRVYLAADNGLIVCMRDMSKKYQKPMRICPEAMVNLPPRTVTAPPKKEGEAMPMKDKDGM